MSSFSLSGHIIDVVNKNIYHGTLYVEEGRIAKIEKTAQQAQLEYKQRATVHSLSLEGPFILPGFVDAHVHIESSMLVPSAFARLAAVHGTTAVVSDPHEIANVLGKEGIEFMIENGRKVPFRFYFGAPSCVPATAFESSGAVLSSDDIRDLLKRDEIRYLSEMMNFPGVIYDDPEVRRKTEIARAMNKVIDGHAPGLSGDMLQKYCEAGISTDHECFTREEALAKIGMGMKILIREGSAAKNFDELISIIREHPSELMFCSDDLHPDDLIKGHINLLVKRALHAGFPLFDVLRCATLNPVRHYGLSCGLLQAGDAADIIMVNNLTDMLVTQSWIGGELVSRQGRSLIKNIQEQTPNRFVCSPIEPEKLQVQAKGEFIRVIEALDGQLITNSLSIKAKTKHGQVISDVENDVLKLVVYNRYQRSEPAVAFIRGFGLKKGAIASTVAHDSHNIIAAGTSDSDLCHVINLLIQQKGGIAIVNGAEEDALPLPVAGIMTNADGYAVAEKYQSLDRQAKQLGSKLKAPFMTLSFMALLVIPELKLSDKGLFDGNTFQLVPLFESFSDPSETQSP